MQGIKEPEQTIMRSADSHVVEPGDLWQERVPAKLRDRAPRIVDSVESLRGPVEGEWLVCDGIDPQRVAGFAAADVDDPRQRSAADERGYGELLSGGWDPVQRLKDQDVDGVGFEVLYPSMALPMFGIPDFELQSACSRHTTTGLPNSHPTILGACSAWASSASMTSAGPWQNWSASHTWV